MVDRATGPDGRLLERPQPRRGLSCVPDPGGGIGLAGDLHVAVGGGGHAREVAEKVEGGPLGGDQRPKRALDPPEHPAAADLVAVAHGPVHLEIRIDLDAGLLGAVRAGHNAGRPRHEDGPGTGGCRKQPR